MFEHATRLFFALRPEPPLARRIAQLAPLFGGAREHLHMTIAILDDLPFLPPVLVAKLRGIGASIAADPFRMALDQISGGTSSIALCPRRKNGALQRIHKEISMALSRAGIPERSAYRFNPHVTLGYPVGQPFSRAISTVNWSVDEFIPVHSHVGLTRHDLFGRWPLRGSGQYRLI